MENNSRPSQCVRFFCSADISKKFIAPIFKQQKNGAIVNFASTLGVIAVPNKSSYAESKAAVIQLTRNLVMDLGSFNI